MFKIFHLKSKINKYSLNFEFRRIMDHVILLLKFIQFDNEKNQFVILTITGTPWIKLQSLSMNIFV